MNHKNKLFATICIRKFANTNPNFKQSGDIGDLIYSLPIIRNINGGNLLLNTKGLTSKKPDGSNSGFDKQLYNLLKPLLEAQHYIRNVKELANNDKIDINLDFFRVNSNFLNPSENKKTLCENILSSFEVPFAATNIPWINCNQKKIAKYVISRSTRYRNENEEKLKILISQLKDEKIFIGLPHEHADFQEKFGTISYYKVRDFLEMAEIINGSEMFIGNQSSPMALAIALHKPFIQESYTKHPDCVFRRENAKYI